MATTLPEAIQEYTDAIIADSLEAPASFGYGTWMDQNRLNTELSQLADFIIQTAKEDILSSNNNFTGSNSFSLAINQSESYKMTNVKVIGNQRPAIVDATTGEEVDRINEILTALRGHGLIET